MELDKTLPANRKEVWVDKIETYYKKHSLISSSAQLVWKQSVKTHFVAYAISTSFTEKEKEDDNCLGTYLRI